jgi:hypothetical protein
MLIWATEFLNLLIALPKYSGYAGYGLETVIGPIEIKPLGLKLKRGFTWFSVGFLF